MKLKCLVRQLTVLTAMALIIGNTAAGAGEVATANNAFGLDLYARLKGQPGNLFLSPYSISTALAMTYAGARGETQKQMARALHFQDSPEQVHAAFGQLQREFNELGKENSVQLNVANALWAQQEHPFLPGFLQLARTDYQANVNQVDFHSAAESARGKINHWVAEQTRDKIQELLPPGSVSAATRLVLANAIYFKGKWAAPFEKSKTATQPFHLTSAKQVDVPLMHRVGPVNYRETPDFQAVEMPYTSNQLAMVVLLPRDIEGSSALERRLNPELLTETLHLMRRREVDLFLPRFKLQSGFNLNQALSAMGMADAFSSAADFSGMDGARDLFISGVYHKAWGEVNEEGTEAAAATGVAMALSAVHRAPQPPPVFRADHPFVFLIRDTQSGAILFMGRMADPQ